MSLFGRKNSVNSGKGMIPSNSSVGSFATGNQVFNIANQKMENFSPNAFLLNNPNNGVVNIN